MKAARTPGSVLVWLLFGACMVALPRPAHAYKRQFHFYLTYLLAHECGLKDAAVIAWANHNTDVYPGASPGVHGLELFDPGKITDRRIFHFPVVRNNDDVVAGSPVARALVEQALSAGEPDPVFLGLALHPYQDSWSHEGYGPVWGHAVHGVTPDLPFLDVARAMRMAEATWGVLDAWSVRTTGAPCRTAWSRLQTFVEKATSERLPTARAMVEYWKSQVQLLGAQALSPESPVASDLEKRFISIVEMAKKRRR